MSATRHLILDRDTIGAISARFPDHPFRLGHQLAGHPLFEPDRLIALADRLPADCIEYNSGNLAISQDPNKTPDNGLTATETIRRIDEVESWVVMKYIELDDKYRDLLLECVEELAPYSEQNTREIHQIEGYIFVSSPGAVTPFHFDDEHNFLLQIRGTKDVHTWDGADPAVVDHLDFERYYNGAHRNIVYRTEFGEKCRTYRLEPGQGLHIPVHGPHWVKNGSGSSISFSVTFRSEQLRREAAVHWLNGKLRARGLSPQPFGASPLKDRLKFQAVRAIRRIRR